MTQQISPTLFDASSLSMIRDTNRVINGNMRIDQRNAGAAISHNADGAQWPADRWSSSRNGTMVVSVQRATVSQNALLTTDKALSATITTAQASLGAGNYFVLLQAIEGQNVADLLFGTSAAEAITLSFMVYSSVTGTFSVALRNNQAARTYLATYTVSAANTWERKTITVPGDTSGTWAIDNTTGLSVCFPLGAGSTFTSSTVNAWQNGNFLASTASTNVCATNGAVFRITDVQIEAGVVATPFANRLVGHELVLCQRYYYITSDHLDVMAPGYVANATTAYFTVATAVPMRAAASTVGTTAVGNFVIDTAPGLQTCSGFTASDKSRYMARFQATCAGGLTTGQAAIFRAGNASARLYFDAEL